jgi:hypothetical protein
VIAAAAAVNSDMAQLVTVTTALSSDMAEQTAVAITITFLTAKREDII